MKISIGHLRRIIRESALDAGTFINAEDALEMYPHQLKQLAVMYDDDVDYVLSRFKFWMDDEAALWAESPSIEAMKWDSDADEWDMSAGQRDDSFADDWN